MTTKTVILASAAMLMLGPWAYAQDAGTSDSPGNQEQTDGAVQDTGRDGAAGTQAQQDDDTADDAGQIQDDRMADSPATDDGEQPAAAPEEMIEPAAGTPLNDQEFVERVAASNRFEIASSELARDRAKDPRVVAFAEHMIEDHAKAGKEFAAARTEADVDSSMTTASTQDEPEAVREHLEALEALNGAEFDEAYVDLQIRAHEDAVELFRAYSLTGSDDDLRAFAEETLPTLEEHLAEVQQLEELS